VPGRRLDEAPWVEGHEVGRFQQGTPISRWALARYLVGRAIGADVSDALLVVGVAILGATVGLYFVAPVWVAVLVGLVGLCALGLRLVLQAALRRLTGADLFGPHDARIRRLVADTQVDVRAELRRLGLPSRRATMPLLGLRLLGRRRQRILQRLRSFDVDRVVPAARLDDLHLIVQNLADPPRG
jgi:hypothetical protein